MLQKKLNFSMTNCLFLGKYCTIDDIVELTERLRGQKARKAKTIS